MLEMLRRFAVALVVALGAVSVMVYAQGLDLETLAGPAFELEQDSGCPADHPFAIVVEPGTQADLNGDGIVCAGAKGEEWVDNSTSEPGNGNGARHVSGHGNFLDGGKKLVQDISFSFHGMAAGEKAGEAKGEFEYHDQTGVGPDLTVHGVVLCLSVDGNVATLIGIVTRSNDINLPEDRLVAWMAEDNGEGAGDVPDTVSRLSPLFSKLPKEICAVKKPQLGPVDILSGNIQVDDDETSGGLPTKLEEKDPAELERDANGVNGHGNFFDGGKKLLQDLSFSFHAIGTGQDGKFVEDVAIGQFEYHDQTGAGPDLTVHGEVLCASISGNFVRLIGVVTRSNDKGLPVDTLVAWSAEDNGEGAADPPDRVSRLAPIGIKLPKDPCRGKPPALPLLPILNGNIQVQ